MLSVGTDILEIARIEKNLNNPRFLKKVFSESELSELEKRGFPAQTAAAYFCAKEAFSKALGTGIKGFSLHEVSVCYSPSGQPYLSFSGNAKELYEICGSNHALSLSHCQEYATAVVILYSKIS